MKLEIIYECESTKYGNIAVKKALAILHYIHKTPNHGNNLILSTVFISNPLRRIQRKFYKETLK